MSHIFASSRGFPKQNFPSGLLLLERDMAASITGTKTLDKSKLRINQINPISGRTHSWKSSITQKTPSFSASYFTFLTFFSSFSIPSSQIPQGSSGTTILGIVHVASSWSALVGMEVFGQKLDLMILEGLSNMNDSVIPWSIGNATHLQLQGHWHPL